MKQLALALLFVGCSTSDRTIMVENNALGIRYVEIVDDDPLAIDAYGDGDVVLGHLSLRTGGVRYTIEPGAIAPQELAGSELSIRVAGETFADVTPGVEPHRVTRMLPRLIEAFVSLAPVADAVQRAAGITFATRSHTAETPYYQMDCSGYTGFFRAGVSVSGCMVTSWGGSQYETRVANPSTNQIIIRGGGQYPSCRTSGGSSACSGAGCYYGPCGFSNWQSPSGSSGHVFEWYDGLDWLASSDNGSGWYENAPYGSNNTTGAYSGISGGTCTCSDCDNGTPTPSGCTTPF